MKDFSKSYLLIPPNSKFNFHYVLFAVCPYNIYAELL